MIASIVVRSLNTGMTTDSSGSDGTAGLNAPSCMEFRNVPRLLILAPNWLGDAVMALPAIADVRARCPQTRDHRGGPAVDCAALRDGAAMSTTS